MEPQNLRNDPPTQDDLAARLEAAIAQRRAEAAVLEDLRASGALADLEANVFVEEPVPASARRLVGRLIVTARRLARKAFLGWYMRPILRQQNSFNAASSRRLTELHARLATLEREVARLRAKAARPDEQPGSP